MKKITTIIATALCVVFSVNTQAQRAENVGDNSDAVAPSFNGVLTGQQLRPDPLLWENGPLFNQAGPPNRSILQNDTFGSNTLGGGVSGDFRIADNFTLDEASSITQIDVYGYQTGAPTTPASIIGVTIQIWDGDPSDASNNVIYGDATTNVMDSAIFSDTFRESEANPGDNRAIQRVTATFTDLTLDAGTYWLDWNFIGDSGFSGPWQPPVAEALGTEPGGGNALQGNAGVYTGFIDDGGDGSVMYHLDAPFELYGLPTAGVDDFSADNISFFPNPVKDLLTIDNRSTTQLETISIYNVQGRLVQTTDISEVSEINVSALTAGVYMVQITSERGTITKKLVKN
ncbi:T9SS type A sorting domain-containing protein [Jejudonia soesokkakensis]|uniref:T9SS type A sorting domain-containing protein n=1 Tax=Jejudonia soesokkakensis TaxID=1323432 RepID=A0ABW2MS25_9FLAO